MAISDFPSFEEKKIVKKIYFEIFPLKFLEKTRIYVIETIQMRSAIIFQLNTYKKWQLCIFSFHYIRFTSNYNNMMLILPVLDVVQQNK